MRFYQHILVLLNTWYLASEARLPYIKSSGYYTPYPPKETSVIYEFQPLKSSKQTSEVSKSRATRDLAWREFDSFLNGNEEPSCADLRRMWRLARELQQEASASQSNLESNEINEAKQMHNQYRSPFKSYSVDKSSSSQEEPVEASQSNKGKNTWCERRSGKLILRPLTVDLVTFEP